MKTKHYPRILCLLTLILFSTISFAQTTHTVTLVCDTDNIKHEDPYKVCYFVNQGEGTDTREFTIVANVGDTIKWQGITLSDDNLEIRKIKYEKGTNVFDKDEIGGSTTVVAAIKKSTMDKPDYTYKISFKVNGRGTMYSIDPVIRVNPR